MAEHHVKLCVECCCIISQCRCAKPPSERAVKWGVCASCFAKPRRHTSRCWNLKGDGQHEKICSHDTEAQASPLQLHAYYYGFKATGNRAIDQILSKVANAGRACHSTENWADTSIWQDGRSLVDLIQEAANQASVAWPNVDETRKLVAKVLSERGCGCCEGYEMRDAIDELAKHLKVKRSSDDSDWDWEAYT